MKTTLKIILMIVFSVPALAQDLSIEKDFEARKPKLTLERYKMGEDATSGFDYLVYRNKSRIVKIREIWSNSFGDPARIEDVFFAEGKPVLLISATLARNNLKNAIRGRKVPVEVIERLFLENSKLSSWTEKGRAISDADPRWKEKQADALERAKNQLENYQFLKTQ